MLRARDVAVARRQRLEDRIEPVDHGLVAADHHAIAALDAPDAAGGADVEIMDAALFQFLAAADVVLPEGVAAVDDDVALLHQLGERLDGLLGDLARRQHHPGGARLLQLLDEILQRFGACRAVGGEIGNSFLALVVNDGGVSVLHQAADDVAAHPPQSDHAELHCLPLTECVCDRGVQHLQPRSKIALQMHPQRAPAAFGQHVEIAARLRRLDDTERRLLAGHRQILRVIGGDLQEHAAVGPALVGLSGRMQEARSELGAGRDATPFAHFQPHVLKQVDVIRLALDIGEQRDVIVGIDAGEMRLQP